MADEILNLHIYLDGLKNKPELLKKFLNHSGISRLSLFSASPTIAAISETYSGRSADSRKKTRTSLSHILSHDIVFEMFDCHLLLGDNRFDDITDGDNTKQTIVINDGEVTNVLVCHQSHALFGCGFRMNAVDMGSHDLLDWNVF
jgi:hypothetical protein